MKIVIISGSNREGASTTLLSAYVGQVLTEKGAEVTLVDLYKQPVPLYSPDPSVVEDENLIHMKKRSWRRTASFWLRRNTMAP